MTAEKHSGELNRVGLPVLGRQSHLVDTECWSGLSSSGKPTWKPCQTRMAVREGSEHGGDHKHKPRSKRRRIVAG